MTAEDVTLELALKLLVAAPPLGPAPGQRPSRWWPINGRYGPYVKCGEETRSLRGGLSPLDVTLGAGPGFAWRSRRPGRGRGRPQGAAEGLRPPRR